MTTPTVIVIVFAILLIALERDRVREFARAVILILTGGILIAPLRGLLAPVVERLSRFLTAQLSDEPETEGAAAGPAGEAGAATTESRHDPRGSEAVQLPTRLRQRERYHVSRIIVSILLTVVVGAVVAFEWTFGLHTMPALLGTPAEGSLPAGLTWVATMALLACTITWGMLLLETLGFTNFMPEMPGRAKPVFKVASFIALGLVLVVSVVMGVWRANEASRPVELVFMPAVLQTAGAGDGVQTDSDAEATETGGESSLDGAARFIVAGVLPALVMLTGAVAFTGVIWLAKYAFGAVLGLALLPFALVLFGVLPVFDNLVGHLILGVHTLIDWIASIGTRVIEAFWPPLLAVRDAVHRKIDAWANRWSPGRSDGDARESCHPGVTSAGADPSARPDGPPDAHTFSDRPTAESGEHAPPDGHFSLFEDRNWGL